MRSATKHRESTTQFPLSLWTMSRKAFEAAIEEMLHRDEDEALRLIAMLDDLDGDCDLEPIDEREPDSDADSGVLIWGGGAGDQVCPPEFSSPWAAHWAA